MYAFQASFVWAVFCGFAAFSRGAFAGKPGAGLWPIGISAFFGVLTVAALVSGPVFDRWKRSLTETAPDATPSA